MIELLPVHVKLFYVHAYWYISIIGALLLPVYIHVHAGYVVGAPTRTVPDSKDLQNHQVSAPSIHTRAHQIFERSSLQLET